MKSQAYNALKTSLQSMEKKTTGSLVTRNLGDLVKKEHFVLDSEYLTTMVVVVPLSMINDWHAKYEKLTDMIVPRSTSMIFQDADHALMTVSLFHKVVDEFKHKVIIFFQFHYIVHKATIRSLINGYTGYCFQEKKYPSILQ